MSEVTQEFVSEIKQAIDGVSVDWYLQNLISIVNKTNMAISITLFVDGSLVSGTLISGKKYFELFADEFAAAWPLDDSRDGIRQAFAKNGEIYDPKGDNETVPPPQFIHLENAKSHYFSGSIPSNRGVLWRGKINAVSGFNLGFLSS